MARKNRRAGGRPQARRQFGPDQTPLSNPGTRRAPRLPVEEVIVPKGKCFFRSRHGKLSFTHEDAQKALARAQATRARQGNGHVESRIYPCPEGGCGKWHLTSRESYTERGQAS